MTRVRRAFLRMVARRCEIHDTATLAKIARLEVATGIDPDAEAQRWRDVQAAGPGGLIASFYDPDLTDCGRQWCRRRRGLTS